MSQKNKGIYRLLSNTFFYSLVQKVMSATSFREKIVKKYITKHNVKVLDIGCGPAEILDVLPKIRYYGFDINPIYINFAKKKYENKGKFFCKKFTNKNTKYLPKFDHVLLLGILHHLSDKEINTLMPNIKKVLKRIGKLHGRKLTVDEDLSRVSINRPGESESMAQTMIDMSAKYFSKDKFGYISEAFLFPF
mgnify:CR=1 FL=1